VYLRQATDKRVGRTYLSIAHNYRDETGKSRIKTVKPLGTLEELQKEYDDPIAHFTGVAKAMEAERLQSKTATITLDMNEQIAHGSVLRKNYGSVVYSKIYHELEIDRFLNNARRHEKHKFNTEAMMRLLVYSRLLCPSSKRGSFYNKDQFFDKFEFDLQDVYSALTHYNKISDNLQKHIHEKIVEQYRRKTDLVYYDVTNYYFETEKQDEFRRKGCSKEGRKTPIVQMGLLMDRESLPIMYKMFPGNTHDSQTLMPMLAEIKKRYKTKRIITVADKGLNSGDNIAFSTALGDGYIYSKSIRGASADFKEWVINPTGYRDKGSDYKLKSKIVPDAKISVTVEKPNNKNQTGKKTIKVEQKWIAFYSEKYAKRAKRKREEVLSKASDMIKNPAKYKGVLDYGAAGYVKNLKVDKSTGEIIETTDILSIDRDKIAEEEKYDGYYAIMTSELDDSDEHIIDMYRGLWRIEESFKITKSVLNTRPIYLQTNEHINAHMLICFISLLIGRIIEKRLGGKYTVQKITETLQKVSCSNIGQNIWVFDHANEVTDDINQVFGIGFGRRQMTLQEIKCNFSQSKSGSPYLQL
jgi:transposase